MENVGKARIYLTDEAWRGHGKVFDQVRIYASGVVRVSQRKEWKSGFGDDEGETEAVYFAPHSWHRIEPTVAKKFTLWVSDVGYDDEEDWWRLASCLGRDEVEPLARQYLRDHYSRFDEDILVESAFERFAHVGLDDGGERKVAFRWTQMPRDTE
ncbi:hypothetical protein [Mycolicibacterium mageritense]|uniref:hypothetical protein n=1 Tax=Mycolicibacterium mageritense TaxID=53462 RepID=UPI001E34A25F|nr:hypothetical protein [Mycolicibacterium mageritense]